MATNSGLHVERKRGNIRPADHSNQSSQEGLAVSILSGQAVAQTRACSTGSKQHAGSIPSTSVKFPELTDNYSGEIISRWQGTQTLPL